MNPFAHKTAVITGAASGIGRALALEFAKAGCNLALSDIDLEGLHETRSLIQQASLRITTRKLDVADRIAVYEYAETTLQEHGTVDVVINNAGVSVASLAAELTYEDFEWLMNINFWGMVYGTQAFLPHLKQRPEAWIANVSSILGIVTIPRQVAYSSAKFAIRGFTESVRYELAGTPVHISSIHPGGIKTEIVRNMRFSGSEGEKRKISSNFDKTVRTTAPQAAKAIVKGLKKKKKRILIGKDAWFLDKMQRLFPTSYEAWVLRQSKKNMPLSQEHRS